MTEIELDYKDVLIKPRASGMRSRSEVAMHSSYSCLWARTPGGDKLNICAVPIIAANMEGVGEIKLADALAKEGAMCVLKKHVPTLDLISFFDSPDPSERETRSKHVMLCVGSSEEEHLRFRNMYDIEFFHSTMEKSQIFTFCMILLPYCRSLKLLIFNAASVI